MAGFIIQFEFLRRGHIKTQMCRSIVGDVSNNLHNNLSCTMKLMLEMADHCFKQKLECGIKGPCSRTSWGRCVSGWQV